MFIDKIICVGKNYLAHAKELGDAIPEKPVIFLKPASVVQQASSWDTSLTLDFPLQDTNVQPECEIAIRIAHDAYQLSRDQAAHAISDITLGLDMTLRTTQSGLKKQGHPWTIAKVFKDAAVLGPWIPCSQFSNYMDVTFEILADGVVKQQAKGRDMMMSPEDLVTYISHYFPLKRGDVIYTGTPEGVFTIEKQTHVTLQWGNYRYDATWK